MKASERLALFIGAFSEEGGGDALGSAELTYLVRAINPASTEGQGQVDDPDLDELAWAFESLGCEVFRNAEPERLLIAAFDRSFRFRASDWAQREAKSLTDIWLLTVAGTVSQRQPELRNLLAELDWQATYGDPPASWDQRVQYEATRALVYLARKAGGWRDIDEALASLRSLAALQQEFQPTFMEANSEPDDRHAAEKRLLGLYHLAEALGVLGRYLRTGAPETALTVLERHSEHAQYMLGSVGDPGLGRIGATLGVVTAAMVRASLWFNTSRLSEAARQFARTLASRDDGAVQELWWSQREALSQSLLDPFKSAVGVQMPTSAGKTLLAEFSIVQSLALNPGRTVAYVVPTRSLVTQITKRLRRDLSDGLIGGRTVAVEAAVPVFELDPTEDSLLSERPDVLVTTPEKLDLLVRSNHTAVAELALVVADEAHHISTPDRGPKLELLLATLKRERGVSCRFLLMTPFLPNARELAEWLGGSEHAAISLDWRPSQQLRALGHWKRERGEYFDSLELVPSATQPNVWLGHEVRLGKPHVEQPTRSRQLISASIAVSLAQRTQGGVLILTRGPGTAEKRALQVSELSRDVSLGAGADPDLRTIAVSYIASELGGDYPLIEALSHRVAFHHAGLPPEVRSLVELMLEEGEVRIVAGTTTLAQGVNFPLAGAIVESLEMPQGRGRKYRPLQYSEFWNIAGRAGRAVQDRVGIVVWPSVSRKQDQEFIEYLGGEAQRVVSALAEVVVGLEDAAQEYGLALVRSQPSLSHFLQYLAHALRVAGYENAMAEVEDILRSSLFFYRLRQDDREVAERLVRWSRRFLESTRDKTFLDVADVTGLSLPSVGLLSANAPAATRSPEFWQPNNLFGEDLRPLTQVVELLANVPEMSLGLTDERGGLNAHRVAGILRDWTTGATLPEIADSWYPEDDREKALLATGRYLFRDLVGQIPWGLGALQLVSLGQGQDSEELISARRTPAMAYYGVKDSWALAMRMVGVPRAAASSLGIDAPAFRSFREAREWVASRPNEAWSQAGRGRRVSGEVLRAVWDATGGSST